MSYLKKLFGVCSIVTGGFLVGEHIWTWEEFSFFDFIGHEWLGLILILFGIGLNINFSKDRFSKELKKLFNKK